jgi:hypothetical protein
MCLWSGENLSPESRRAAARRRCLRATLRFLSGDGDFHCLIEYLEKKKKLGRIIIPNRKTYSQLLWKFRKYMDYMNNLKNKLEKRSK